MDDFAEMDFNTLVRCVSEAVHKIDGVFGKGYAKEHPETVRIFMQVAAKGTVSRGSDVKEDVR